MTATSCHHHIATNAFTTARARHQPGHTIVDHDPQRVARWFSDFTDSLVPETPAVWLQNANSAPHRHHTITTER